MSDRQHDTDAVQFPVTALAAIQRALADEHGPEEAGRLMREMGTECAPAFQRLFSDFVARRGHGELDATQIESDTFWGRLSDFFASAGWGRLEPEQLHPGVLGLGSSDWTEAGQADGEHPACHFTTGLLAGLLRQVAGQDLAVLEVECRGAGHDRCRFLVGSEETLAEVFGRIRGGWGYAEAVNSLA